MKTIVEVDWNSKYLSVQEIETNNPCNPHLVISVKLGEFIIKTKGNDLMFTLPNDKNAQLTVTAVDADGNPAQVESITYTSSNPEVATVDETGLVTSVSIGTAQINVTADADLSEGVTELIGLLEVEVVSGQAVAFTVSASLV